MFLTSKKQLKFSLHILLKKCSIHILYVYDTNKDWLTGGWAGVFGAHPFCCSLQKLVLLHVDVT